MDSNLNKKQIQRAAILVLVIVCILAILDIRYAIIISKKLDIANSRLVALNESIQQVQLSNQQFLAQRQLLILADMANHVEELTRGLQTDQEKALAIACWIAANISNRLGEFTQKPGMNDVYTWYAERAGACGARSVIFVEMLKLANIPSKLFNLYDFPSPPSGHTVVQVWYGGAWHFYDVTYAGVFMDGENVMSFEEILANPQNALDNMVVFEETIDKIPGGNHFDENGNPITATIFNSVQRMRNHYNLETLVGFTSYHFVDGYDIAIIHPRIDGYKLPMVFGSLNRQWTEIRYILIEQQSDISQYIGHGLAGAYHIKSDWYFTNLVPGATYCLVYHYYGTPKPGSRTFAIPSDAEIISGQEHILSRNAGEWTIVFTPQGSECRIFIDYDIRVAGDGVHIDMIEIGRVQ